MQHSPYEQPRPVIIVRIEGGLGNQMFEYAIGRRLAYMANGHLVLMLEDNYESRDGRKIGLTDFNIIGDFAFEATIIEDLKRLFPSHPSPVPEHQSVEVGWWNFKPMRGTPELAARPYLSFIPDILTWRKSLILKGFWQNERYFSDIPLLIKNDFTLRIPFDQRNREALARIRSGPSAFIHVRRGDYLAPLWTQILDGVSGADYYHRAFEALKSRHGADLKAFVFSDDPAWVRENQIGGPGAEIIDWNGAMPAHDITLMRYCNHAIISSSTFSWWGAWLGDHPGRTVIAPQPWFRPLPEYTEIVPERWLRL